jgi:hypothetical protein
MAARRRFVVEVQLTRMIVGPRFGYFHYGDAHDGR